MPPFMVALSWLPVSCSNLLKTSEISIFSSLFGIKNFRVTVMILGREEGRGERVLVGSEFS